MDPKPVLERRSPVGIPYALLILVLVFFFMPTIFRSARLSLEQKENDVKDWLPSDFRETAELEWFADHFVGESFVLATWEGCTSGDQRLQLLATKLRHESEDYDGSVDLPPEQAASYQRAKGIGRELQLVRGSDQWTNWGGQGEKWFMTPYGQWFYLTPDGHLYRWDESQTGPAALVRALRRELGAYELRGQLVTALGKPPQGDQVNPYYNDPALFCAPLFHTVQTGDSIVNELAREGGPLWPIDLTDEAKRPVVAQRRAMQRLTGMMFAPAVPPDFAWTPAAFRTVVAAHREIERPQEFDALVTVALQQIIDEQFDGDLARLRSATSTRQAEAWYAVFDAIEIEPPPRLTCVLVTLTDLAKDTLAFPLGRGILGQPRGRLLQLAAESGLTPAPTPSLLPPPFDQQAPISVGGMPALRLGGPPVDNMAIDEEGTITLVRLVGYSVVLGVVLSYLCFRSLKITLMVFVVGGLAAMLSMAVVGWTDGRVDAILLSMPSLVYVLGLSGAIHVVNYYRDEVRARGLAGAPDRALRHALLPCTLASVTTAIGLISLHTSNLAPISNFGFYAALGVVLTLGILFSFLPAALQTFAPGVAGGADQRAAPITSSPDAPPPAESRLSDWWAALGGWVTRRHALVTVTSLLVLCLGGYGLTNIKTSVQLLKLFDSESRIIDDYAWLETHFGKLVPMELIVRMPPAIQASIDAERETKGINELDLLERAEAASRIRTVVFRTLGEPGLGIVGQATGADSFLPPLPATANNYSPIRAKFNRDLLAAGDQLRDNDYLRVERSGPYAGSELWRISLRVAALSDVDYGQFIAILRQAVHPVLRAYDVRQALLAALPTEDGQRLIGKPRVLVVGSEKPASLQTAPLITDEGELATDNAFVATLGELLSAERIEQPQWREVPADRAREIVANEKWESYVNSFDAVIWLGSRGFRKTDFAAAAHLIDAQSILAAPEQPTLIEGTIPSLVDPGALQVIYTGVVPVVYKAQRTLLSSLADSIGLAFCLIAGVMILLLNPGRAPWGWLAPSNLRDGCVAGMIAMIPNLFPVLLVFGLMGHLEIAIDIGTMMTASVAMGVAVDDTIHFLTWFREHLDRGLHRVDAVIQTYRRVGPAMTQTTIVGGLGLFVFALSTFTPTQRFGTLMLVMLATALVGDLLLLPALLAGPAGKWFKPRRERSGRSAQRERTAPSEPAWTPDPRGEHDAPARPKVHLPGRRTDPPHRVK